jgi:hypothetical protein
MEVLCSVAHHPPLLESCFASTPSLLNHDHHSPRPSTNTLLIHFSRPPFPMSKTQPSRWVSDPQRPNQQLPMTLAGMSNTSPLGPPITPRLPRPMAIKRRETLLPNPFPRAHRKIVIQLPQAPIDSRCRKLSTCQPSTPVHFVNSSPTLFIPGVAESSNRALLNGGNCYSISRRSATSATKLHRCLMNFEETIHPGSFIQFFSDGLDSWCTKIV